MDIFSSLPQIESIEYNANEGYPKQLVDAAQPVVLKGFIRDWPLVKVAQESTDALKAYLLAAYNDNPVHLMQAPAEYPECVFGRPLGSSGKTITGTVIFFYRPRSRETWGG